MNIYPKSYFKKVTDISTEFLQKNKSEVYMYNSETKDYKRKYEFMDNWD